MTLTTVHALSISASFCGALPTEHWNSRRQRGLVLALPRRWLPEEAEPAVELMRVLALAAAPALALGNAPLEGRFLVLEREQLTPVVAPQYCLRPKGPRAASLGLQARYFAALEW